MDIAKLRSEYNLLPDVFCPHLQENIVFNAKGFGHLLYKNGARRRSEQDSLLRFDYLKKAVEVLRITTTVQEKEVRENTRMLGYIAFVGDLKLKVIVRKIGTGYWHFYSVIPHFVTSPKRDAVQTKNPPVMVGTL